MEASKASHDTLSASLAEKEDKLSRIIKTARALKTKNEALKTDKDSVDKEFEETKGDTLTLSPDICLSLLSFKLQLHTLRMSQHWN